MRARLALSLAIGLVVARSASAVVAYDGHLYELVPGLFSWDEARAAAAARIQADTPGYLATITSAEEQAVVLSLLPTTIHPAWIGASDVAVEGTWVWETGPEAGTVFWKNGAPFGGAYTGWRAGEPNDFQGEDHLSVYGGGWVDWDRIRMGYVVEYSFEEAGFAFGMSEGRLGAIRNESPAGQIQQLEIVLPDGTFLDTAPAAPGLEFTPWSVLAASGGASATFPEDAVSDGQQSTTLVFASFDPMDEMRLSVDLDRLSAPDGGADVIGTFVRARFSTGDVLSGLVQPGSVTILGVTYLYSVRPRREPDWDIDGIPDSVDVCPRVPDPAQTDSGGIGTGSAPDGIGDACQCGDVNGDGRVTLGDAVLIGRSLLTPPTATLARPQLCDVGGSAGCSTGDAVVIRRALLAPPTASVAQQCSPPLP